MQFDVIKSDELSKEAQVDWCSSWWRFRLQNPREVTSVMQGRRSLQSLARGRVTYQGLAFFHIRSWFQCLVADQKGLTRSSVLAPFV